MSDERVTVKLTGVPETLLWPLYGRASEANRHDGLLRDSRALRLMESIDYPFVERFGRPSQVFALRARCFDKVVKEFLDRYHELLRLIGAGYRREGKRYLTLAIGCTGGKHRSVALSEELAARLASEDGMAVKVVHRDLGRE